MFVTKKRYDALLESNKALMATNAKLCEANRILKGTLDTQQRTIDSLRDSAMQFQNMLARARRSNAALKGVITKLKNKNN